MDTDDLSDLANPSPTEIAIATARIREGWTPTIERRRRVIRQQKRIEGPMVIALADIDEELPVEDIW